MHTVTRRRIRPTLRPWARRLRPQPPPKLILIYRRVGGTRGEVDGGGQDLNSNVHNLHLYVKEEAEPGEGDNHFYLEDGEEADTEPWGEQSHHKPYSMHDYDGYSSDGKQ